MKKIAVLYLLFLSTFSMAQQNQVKGDLYDEKGHPLQYAAAVLLYPNDSTMAYYGITDESGHFEIKNIQAGAYILQTSYIGYESFYKNLELPLTQGSNLGAIAMKPRVIDLPEARVNAERIPFVLKKDTIEYSTGSYKVKPDAVAEDLLTKLPGVQVDRSGNIKAQGEQVKNVLVDGKEFFGSDPQVATKNLPADAIDKVQVYNKKSDESEMTGIEDGNYDKTINLILKDGKKSAIFGDVIAGIGTHDRYEAAAKVYRFTRKYQFAALGMLNNVNKYGFSFRDYLDFNGGLQSIMNGGNGQVHIGTGEEFPINFGQTINGLVTSGAAGANFTYEARKNNRFNISYLGSGADKILKQNTITNNFYDTGSFIQNENLDQNTTNRAHRINFGWKNRIDSTQNLIFNGGFIFTKGTAMANSSAGSFENDIPVNHLTGITNDDAINYAGNLSASYLKKWENNWKLFNVKGTLSMKNVNSNSDWANIIHYIDPPDSLVYKAFQKESNNLLKYSASSSVTRKIGRSWYLVPGLSAGAENESLDRVQGIPPGEENRIDSLSPDFSRQFNWILGNFSVKRNTKKSQLTLMAGIENTVLSNVLNSEDHDDPGTWFFIPGVSWHYDYSTGRQFGIYYGSSVNAPSANQLLPVVNNANPLQLYQGNQSLKPEYRHDLQFNWIYFDQFSLISIFTSLNANYTHDKINWSRTIMPNLSQLLSLVNVPDDYRVDASIDFSTPVRPLKLDFNARLDEGWNQGINLVNSDRNTVTNFTHSLTLKINNRKKDKLDVSVGGTVQVNDARYSVQNSLNKVYLNYAGFADIAYTPGEKWYFSLNADLNRYDAASFGNAIGVPLLKAAITRYFLKNNRGVVTLEAFDLLNRNTGITRVSEMNYLLEQQSNTIGRYVMLSFKYRLNKFENKSGIDIQMNRR